MTRRARRLLGKCIACMAAGAALVGVLVLIANHFVAMLAAALGSVVEIVVAFAR